MTKLFFDIKCDGCGNLWTEYLSPLDNGGMCPSCGSAMTHKMPGGLKHFKAKDPYDYLDKPMPDPKKIFSGPKVKSK